MSNKKDLPQADTSSSPESGFPILFSLEDFRNDILNVYLCYLRVMSWMAHPETVWRVTGKPALEYAYSLMDPDQNAEALQLTYADIKQTDFARYLESMYQYGCLGVYDGTIEDMENETGYTWITAIVDDANRSRFIEEWGAYGGDGESSAKNCYFIAELANARRVLEGHEQFYPFGGRETGYTESRDALDVHQMALLAGMEEMSIRAAANPKRANPLLTYSDEGRTRIRIAHAKAWLQAKGRYVQITHQWTGGDIDLNKRSMKHIDDASDLMISRLHFLDANLATRPNHSQFQQLLSKYGYDQLPDETYTDETFLKEAAEILQFPPDLFILRMEEAWMRTKLLQLEHKLKDFGVNTN